MPEHTESAFEEHEPKPDLPNLWIMPLLVMGILTTAVLILVFSNPDTVLVQWAGLDVDAPLWVVLLITFGAGLVGGPLSARVWTAFRRRRRRLKGERDAIRKATES